MKSRILSVAMAMGVLLFTVSSGAVAASHTGESRAPVKEELEKAHKAGTHGGNTEVEKSGNSNKRSGMNRAPVKEDLEKAHKAGTHGGNTEVEKSAK